MRLALLAIPALLLSPLVHAADRDAPRGEGYRIDRDGPGHKRHKEGDGSQRGDGYRVERVTPAKKSIKVLSPEGAKVRILQSGSVEKAKGTIPFEYTPTDSGAEYAIEVTLADGEAWWKGSVKVQDRTEYQVYVDGPRETVKVVSPTTPSPSPVPAVPTAMADADFSSLKEAIKGEAFSDSKLDVLKTGTQTQAFTIAQVVELVDLFSFSKDKVKVVETISKQIVDRQNAFKLYSAFTFSADKEKVKKILSK